MKPNTTFGSTSPFPPADAKSDNEDHSSSTLLIQDRSDTVESDDVYKEDVSENQNFQMEPRTQTLQNFQLKKTILKHMSKQREEDNEKQKMFNNHRMIYQVNPRFNKL